MLLADGQRQCPHCEKVYPATADHFARNAALPGGLGAYCRSCERKRDRARYRRRANRHLADRAVRQADLYCARCHRLLAGYADRVLAKWRQPDGAYVCVTCQAWQPHARGKRAAQGRRATPLRGLSARPSVLRSGCCAGRWRRASAAVRPAASRPASSALAPRCGNAP